jgi:hypothetical protein
MTELWLNTSRKPIVGRLDLVIGSRLDVTKTSLIVETYRVTYDKSAYNRVKRFKDPRVRRMVVLCPDDSTLTIFNATVAALTPTHIDIQPNTEESE